MDKQLQLAPQMRNYHSAEMTGMIWMPYVMFHSGFPKASNSSVNIDCFGFREGTASYNRKTSFECLANGGFIDENVDLFIGGSTAFGVGAISNKATIPSLVSESSNIVTINMGMRKWVLEQNLIQFLSIRSKIPKNQSIRRIRIFAGYNEFHLFLQRGVSAFPYGQFFSWSEYFCKMNDRYYDESNKEFNFPSNIDTLVVDHDDFDKRRQEFVSNLEGTLSNWKVISEHLGCALEYILQPV